MSVRIKTLIIIILTYLTLVGIFYFISRWFLIKDANAAEDVKTTQDVSRLQEVLDDDIVALNSTVSDWAPWDDTYEFINTGDAAYLVSNIPSNDAFTNIGVELMLFINNSGRIVFGRMVDLVSGKEIPVPQSLVSQLQVGSRLLSHKDASDQLAGILALPEGPMVIVAQPILTSLGEGPIRGTLIMGRRLDDVEIARLSQRTQLSFSIFPYTAETLPEDVSLARNSLNGAQPKFIAPRSGTVISGYTLVYDVYGNPALILRVDSPRDLYIQAGTHMKTLGLALLAIGIVLGLATLFILDRMVITRLTDLSSSVLKIGKQGTAFSRVEARGKDEIFTLASSVNSMLNSLEDSLAKERESEQRYRQLLEFSPDAIIVNSDDKFVYVNPAAVGIYGAANSLDLLGKPMLDLVHPAYRKVVKEQIRCLFDDRESVLLEEKFLRLDGSEIEVEVAAISIMYQGKAAVLMVIRDIAARKKAEEQIKNYSAHLEETVDERTRELREAQEQLVRKEKLAVLGQLAGGVGHELRNPLSVISTSIYYLRLVQPEADEKIKQHQAMIAQEVNNADKIITDLLDFARAVSAEKGPVSVPELVQKVLTRFPAPASVKVVLDLPAGLPQVLADGRQMEQVLGSLVMNAYQAMVTQTGTLLLNSDSGFSNKGKLTISARELAPVPGRGGEQGMVAIAVKDTGTGIAPENMKKIFEPLFTTKAKGIGLGLAVGRKLAEANGGRIEVESEAGNGSTFTLYLCVYSG